MENYSILIWQILNFAGILLLVYLVIKLIKRAKTGGGKILFFLILVSAVALSFSSCIDAEESNNQYEVEILLSKYKFDFDKLDSKKKEGLVMANLNELENTLRMFRGLNYDVDLIENLLISNGVYYSPEDQHSESIADTSSERILCVQNAHLVNARVGLSPFTTLNINFGVSNGGIQNFNTFLTGLTAFITLGPGSHVQDIVPTSSNNWTYGLMVSYTINYVFFLEGAGTIYTSEVRTLRVRVNACSGAVEVQEIIW